MQSLPLLSLSIWIPILSGIFVLVFGSNKEAAVSRKLALGGSVLSLLVTLPLIWSFDNSSSKLQFVERTSWIQRFNVEYYLGVDGISVWFVVLTALITVIVIVSAWEVIQVRVAQYLGAFLVLSGLMIGVFCAADGLLFYVFFEATLIPMYIIIGVWGGPNRVYAAFKFFLYTLAGSLLMLIALIYLYRESHTFEIAVWQMQKFDLKEQIMLFIAFFLAFAVKVPMWPVHTWLPDAHVEAPTGGSIVLAAIMLKLGGYGFVRFSLPVTPDACHFFTPVMIALSLIAVIYVGVVALVQTDMKKLVAYSSIAHMGFVTLGFFLFSQMGVEGAIVQMISHGFVSGAMFFAIGVLYDRMHTRDIAAYGGVANRMPRFAAFALFFAMANVGLPATSGFVGEFMVILASVKYNFWIGALAGTTLIFGAAYTLWMYKRVYFGAIVNDQVAKLKDINSREFSLLAVMAVLVLFMGLYPKPFTDKMHESVASLLAHVGQSKL